MHSRSIASRQTRVLAAWVKSYQIEKIVWDCDIPGSPKNVDHIFHRKSCSVCLWKAGTIRTMTSRFYLRIALLYAASFWILPTLASRGTPEHGLIGYGINMYKPVCASACRASVSNPLNCADHQMVKRMGGMKKKKESPECYANNDPFLQTVAYCISTHCQDVPIWKLEQWWAKRIPGKMPHQPQPKQTYQETLASITTPPQNVTASDDMLMETSLVDEDDYISNYNGNYIFEKNEVTHARHGYVGLPWTTLCIVADRL